MEVSERAPAFPPQLSALKTAGTDVAGGAHSMILPHTSGRLCCKPVCGGPFAYRLLCTAGSPSSSRSCHDSHSHHNTSALQATEGLLPVRTHHFRKNTHLNRTTSATREAAAPEAPNQVPEALNEIPQAQLPESAPGDKRSRRKATKQWEVCKMFSQIVHPTPCRCSLPSKSMGRCNHWFVCTAAL